jgi:putative transposase
VQRRFVADRPNTLSVTDITEHCTQRRHGALLRECWMCTRKMIVGWSIADHVRTDLVVRCPADGVLATATAAGHDLSWQPGQYTSWAFGHRLRQARLPGSMGRVASVDNAMIESFWSTV